jgi:hypothetical protein
MAHMADEGLSDDFLIMAVVNNDLAVQVDWDYHMRLAHAGIPGCESPGSIIHFYHFRHWRLTGIAYEIRDSSYTATNWTLLSCATGRTREFKDRCCSKPLCCRLRWEQCL